MNSTLNATSSVQSNWPLAATLMPNAHISWSAYASLQQAQAERALPEPARMGHERSSGIAAFAMPASATDGPGAPLAWPLPATLLPNAHLSWAEWTAAQADALDGSHPTSDQLEQAA